MAARIPVCVFAKPPAPGVVKTRLIPEVGADGAARLARAFLEDTWFAVRELRWARPILALTRLPDDPIGRSEVWLQGRGDLGARLWRVLSRALREGPAALAIGADTPGLPPALLERAREALTNHDAVLGPAQDGGFYLIGLRRLPRGLFARLPWSAGDTFERTRERLRMRGLATALLPAWFDVDRPRDLKRLRRRIARGEVIAPATALALSLLPVNRPKRRSGPRSGSTRPRRP